MSQEKEEKPLSDFHEPSHADFKAVDPKLFEMLDTTFKAIREIVRLLQKPDREVQTQQFRSGVPQVLVLETLKKPQGAIPILLDAPSGLSLDRFTVKVLDERRIEVMVRVVNAAGGEWNTPVGVRIWVFGA